MKKAHEIIYIRKISDRFKGKMKFDEIIEYYKYLFDKIGSYERD